MASIDAGLLYLFAIASLSVYGTSLAGWASNNKLALLGGVRASSQMVSYEVSMGLSLVGTMMAYRTLRLEEMVVAQGARRCWAASRRSACCCSPSASSSSSPRASPRPSGRRSTCPRARAEIVGYFIEYSGMKFGMMFLAEFLEIAVFAGVITAIFLGGWHPLVVDAECAAANVHAASGSAPSAPGPSWSR